MTTISIDLLDLNLTCVDCDKKISAYDAIYITEGGALRHYNCQNTQLRCDVCNNLVDVSEAFAASGVFYHEACYEARKKQESP